ncbi:MAG: bifunctional demethylmenaquinone methyltransferase/2-methoxy-6-polyprenyl-1,4-benzoquinol methylase [Deltaproteobacteria bacterium RIFCSPLOWO2_12_FULL_43_16]|nr:MAG: bifunctional demethylmenaquinone methyltransferase/2-methoxy-6-polyprenyl-1,4-benzoquinol methylase [Deltaproteobacteria bacterium GWA2_43_19]OGQ11282.1 MAG: bifunctional demethylmenaquinone methyltransferase/2-methoxy-6-polyprenyl-1,4-benzoquinol methylase [Deltaproteobacteria bacterium RIFCSPHIGHO2_02_FULL_43_33]OGQ34851.1 MAG: bifunctional demethylmenaquinone methyltransferase/2-methoxy-6-polyprenyl-1,4-benzoquinol methylase [Deltaproteobacteria bacterium RIFCSPLOWO2_01_FULL_42_9]OGQ6
MDKKSTTHFGNQIIPAEEKKQRVQEIFSSVADKYDLMNDLMSLGTHRLWKRFVAEKTNLREGDSAIDVCGGTADIAMLMVKRVGEKGKIVVYDINKEMLEFGREKCIDKGFLKNIQYVQGDAEEIAFANNTFHCATVGFGIRNVTYLEKAFKEMMRVVKPGGRVICLEFSHPTSNVFSKLYDLYSFKVMPEIGEVVTGNREAYTYLPESIRKFPTQEELKKLMEGVGLFKVKYYNFFNGIAAVHIGTKV